MSKCLSKIVVVALGMMLPGVVWAQASAEATVSGGGTARVELRPTRLRIQVRVEAHGKNVESALTTLRIMRETAAAKVKGLQADADSIVFTPPVEITAPTYGPPGYPMPPTTYPVPMLPTSPGEGPAVEPVPMPALPAPAPAEAPTPPLAPPSGATTGWYEARKVFIEVAAVSVPAAEATAAPAEAAPAPKAATLPAIETPVATTPAIAAPAIAPAAVQAAPTPPTETAPPPRAVPGFVPGGMPAPGGPSVTPRAPNAPQVTVSTTLTAQWTLKSTDPDKLLIEADAIRAKVNAARLGGNRATSPPPAIPLLQPTPPAFSDEAQTTPAYGSAVAVPYSPYVAAPPDGVTFIYVAEITGAQRKAALASAFAKARQQAAELATAAGGSLGPLSSVSEPTGPGASPYISPAPVYAAPGLACAPANENEATSATPEPIIMTIAVNASFRLAPPAAALR